MYIYTHINCTNNMHKTCDVDQAANTNISNDDNSDAIDSGC